MSWSRKAYSHGDRDGRKVREGEIEAMRQRILYEGEKVGEEGMRREKEEIRR